MTLPLRASFQGKREENSVRLLKLVSMLGSTTREASIPAGAQDGEALLLEVLLKVKALGNHQVRLFATPWTAAHAAEDRLLCPQNSPGKNTGVGCRALLQGIFPTQGPNPHLLHLMYRQAGTQGRNPHLLHLLYRQAGSLPLAPAVHARVCMPSRFSRVRLL